MSVPARRRTNSMPDGFQLQARPEGRPQSALRTESNRIASRFRSGQRSLPSDRPVKFNPLATTSNFLADSPPFAVQHSQSRIRDYAYPDSQTLSRHPIEVARSYSDNYERRASVPLHSSSAANPSISSTANSILTPKTAILQSSPDVASILNDCPLRAPISSAIADSTVNANITSSPIGSIGNTPVYAYGNRRNVLSRESFGTASARSHLPQAFGTIIDSSRDTFSNFSLLSTFLAGVQTGCIQFIVGTGNVTRRGSLDAAVATSFIALALQLVCAAISASLAVICSMDAMLSASQYQERNQNKAAFLARFLPKSIFISLEEIESGKTSVEMVEMRIMNKVDRSIWFLSASIGLAFVMSGLSCLLYIWAAHSVSVISTTMATVGIWLLVAFFFTWWIFHEERKDIKKGVGEKKVNTPATKPANTLSNYNQAPLSPYTQSEALLNKRLTEASDNAQNQAAQTRLDRARQRVHRLAEAWKHPSEQTTIASTLNPISLASPSAKVELYQRMADILTTLSAYVQYYSDLIDTLPWYRNTVNTKIIEQDVKTAMACADQCISYAGYETYLQGERFDMQYASANQHRSYLMQNLKEMDKLLEFLYDADTNIDRARRYVLSIEAGDMEAWKLKKGELPRAVARPPSELPQDIQTRLQMFDLAMATIKSDQLRLRAAFFNLEKRYDNLRGLQQLIHTKYSELLLPLLSNQLPTTQRRDIVLKPHQALLDQYTELLYLEKKDMSVRANMGGSIEQNSELIRFLETLIISEKDNLAALSSSTLRQTNSRINTSSDVAFKVVPPSPNQSTPAPQTSNRLTDHRPSPNFSDEALLRRPTAFSSGESSDSFHSAVSTEQPIVHHEHTPANKSGIPSTNPPISIQSPSPTIDSSDIFQVVTLFDYNPEDDRDLSFVAGEILVVVDTKYDPCWYAFRPMNRGLPQVGTIPSNFVKRLDKPGLKLAGGDQNQ